MKLTQLIESFVISNDEFEDYLNRATEQLVSELESGKNSRDAVHDLSLSFAEQHNKSYAAYERMQDSLSARMYTLGLGASTSTELAPVDMHTMPDGTTMADGPEMMTDPMGDMEMELPTDDQSPDDGDMEDYAAVMDNKPEVEESYNLPAAAAGLRTGVNFRSGAKASGPVSKSTYNSGMNALAKSKTAVKPTQPMSMPGRGVTESSMDQDMWDTIKRGDKITIGYDSAIKKDNLQTFVVRSKNVVGKAKIGKITMTTEDGKGKYFLYNRNGKISLALGDMAASMTSAMVESKESEEKARRRALTKADEPERGEERKKVSLKKAPWEESVNEAAECKYCGGDCPNDEDHACDGYSGDIDGLYEESYQDRYNKVASTANAIKIGKSNASMPQDAVRKVSGDSSYKHADNPFYAAKADARKNDGLGVNGEITKRMKPGADGKFKWGRDKLTDSEENNVPDLASAVKSHLDQGYEETDNIEGYIEYMLEHSISEMVRASLEGEDMNATDSLADWISAETAEIAGSEPDFEDSKEEVFTYMMNKISDNAEDWTPNSNESINEAAVQGIDALRDIVAEKQAKSIKFDDGSMKVDMFTASAIVAIYDKVNDKNREKMDRFLTKKSGLMKLADFAMGELKEGRLDELAPLALLPVAARLAMKAAPKIAKFAMKHKGKLAVGGAVAHGAGELAKGAASSIAGIGAKALGGSTYGGKRESVGEAADRMMKNATRAASKNKK